MKPLYRIGEVSELYDISLDTLRHYDHIGLLKPIIDETNGYRYYSYQHLDILEMILSFKLVDIPLKDVKELIESENVDHYYESISIQQHLLKEKKDILEHMIKQNDVELELLKLLKNFENDLTFNSIQIVRNPNIAYIPIDKLPKNKNYNAHSLSQVFLYNVDRNSNTFENGVFGILDDSKAREGSYHCISYFGTQKQIEIYVSSFSKHLKLKDTTVYVVYTYSVLKESLDHQYYVTLYSKKDN